MKLAAGLHVCSQVDSLTLNCQLWLKSVSADAIQLEMCQLISATTNKHWRRLLVQFSATKNDTIEIDRAKPSLIANILLKRSI